MVAVVRGNVVVVALPGDYGKPRPAVVVQSDRYADDFESVILCPLTKETLQHPALRVRVHPTAGNHLISVSDVMMEKVMAVHRSRVARVIGRLDNDTMRRIDRSLTLILGLR